MNIDIGIKKKACLCRVYLGTFILSGNVVFGGQSSSETRQGGNNQTTSSDDNTNKAQSFLIKDRSVDRGVQEDRTNLLESFAIAKNSNAVFLPVSIKGKSRLFMLDTGSTLHTFDLSLRHCLGNPIRIGTAKTESTGIVVHGFESPTVRIGKLTFDKDELVMCANLKMLRAVHGEDIYGLLGVPFFKRQIVQIDMDHGTLSVFKVGTPSDAEWGQAFPITFDELGGPILEASITDDASIHFLIDVGMNTTGTLTNDLFNHLVNRNMLRITGDRIVATEDGNLRQITGRLNELRIGQFRHQNLIFGQGKYNKLGLAYLSRYRVTFDLPDAKVYFKKAKAYSRIDHEDMSGL